ncbi:MAG: hypothetical protein OD815_000186 [Candidatus Alkanophagales archaeon MCA70_species_2]|nr:hypothetical protein [Candidatus Alkanophaga liquidiphilum]
MLPSLAEKAEKNKGRKPDRAIADGSYEQRKRTDNKNEEEFFYESERISSES